MASGPMTGPDEIMQRLGDGVAAHQQGERSLARTILQGVWDDIGGSEGDPFHRCGVAHSMADVQDKIQDELTWDLRALEAAELLTDERVKAAGVAGTARSFYPSLHLNLADVYLRLGDTDNALRHVHSGNASLLEIDDNGYFAMIREGLARIATELLPES